MKKTLCQQGLHERPCYTCLLEGLAFAAGVESAWHLERVQVHNEATGQLVTFRCRAWLDTMSGDGLIKRTFCPATDCDYKLELQV